MFLGRLWGSEKWRRYLCGCVAGLVFGLLPARATAQSTEQALAEQLFQQGQELVRAGRFREACPKFAESQRLDPGTGTLLNLANCYEQSGQLASSWATYLEVVSAAKRDGRPDRVEFAETRAKELAPKLSRVVFEWSGPGDPPEGFLIKLDRSNLSATVLGVESPIDAGEHTVVVSATGKKSFTAKLSVRADASTSRFVIPKLEDAPPEKVSSVGASGPRDEESPGKTQRISGVVTAGVGVVGLAVGGVFGVVALGKFDDSKKNCTGDDCLPDGTKARLAAREAGDMATVFMIAGGVLAAGGAILYFTAPSKKGDPTKASAFETRPTFLGNVAVFAETRPSGLSLNLEGTF